MRFLADHPLGANISQRMGALAPRVPNVAGLVAIPVPLWGKLWNSSVGNVSISFDSTGAISHLQMQGRDWAAAGGWLGRYLYRTYNDTDLNAAGKTCCYGASGRQKIANPQSTVSTALLTGLWVDSFTAPRTFVLSLSMAALQHGYYGAPSAVWIQIQVVDEGRLDMDLQLFNKTATRLAEASFFSFLPSSINSSWVWVMDKLGSWVNPLDVVASGGLHQHGVRDGVSYRYANQQHFSIDTLDATVVDPVTPSQQATMFPFPLHPLQGPVIGWDVQLHQNAFNTNTPLFSWDSSFRWRFRLRAAMK